MNLEEKFALCAGSNGYQRIDKSYSVDIYVGYTQNGNMSLAIIEQGRPILVKSSKQIEVNLGKRQDGKFALTFDLLDGSYRAMYLFFVRDMIDVCEKAGKVQAIAAAITRWKYWKELFGKSKEIILSKQEIRGLVGELIELKEHFLKDFDPATAVRSWMGPLQGHKDFEINDTWYEVKTVHENAVHVKISSLEQLASDIDGHLVIIRLEDTSATSNQLITLNSIVKEIMELLPAPEERDLFMMRLENMGYIVDAEYDKFCFLFKGRECYAVKDKFPRLTHANVDKFIDTAVYTIILSGISEYKES